jgi:plastocyanin domain-containing protein
MFKKNTLWAILATCSISLGTASAAMPTSASPETGEFQPIEQPLALKVGVTVGGLALIGLELWWFLFSKSPAQTNGKPE